MINHNPDYGIFYGQMIDFDIGAAFHKPNGSPLSRHIRKFGFQTVTFKNNFIFKNSFRGRNISVNF